jgi:hypothetical protein
MTVEVVCNVLKWQVRPEVPAFAIYALIWEFRSYGGHIGDEMVIRNRHTTAILVPNSFRL